MTTDLALAIGVMIIAGYFGGQVAKKLKLPRITGYIVVGLLLSPSVLNLVPRATVESLNIITSVALGIIAYAIGGSLRLQSIRKLGRSIAWITIVQALAAWLIVTLGVVFLAPRILGIPQVTVTQFYFPMAFVIGAIACATDPATILAVTREYRAKGPLTTTLLALVAIDDAVAVIAFAIERIHAANLINFGILPLLFADQADYDRIDENDQIVIDNVREQLAVGKPVIGKVIKSVDSEFDITLKHQMSEEDIKIVLAGGRLNCT